jgi:hypothetical protein
MNILQKISKQDQKIKNNNLEKKYIKNIKQLSKNFIKDAIISCPICYNKQTKHSIVLFSCSHVGCINCLNLYFTQKKYNYSTIINLTPECLYAKISNHNVIGTYNKPKCFVCNQDIISFCIQKPKIQTNLQELNPSIYILLKNFLFYYTDNISNSVYYPKINKKENYKLYNAKIKKINKFY